MRFEVVREGNRISLVRRNPDGSRTPMTIPSRRLIKGATLRLICTQAAIDRDDFLGAYERS